MTSAFIDAVSGPALRPVTAVAVDEGTVLVGGARVTAEDGGGESLIPINGGALVRSDGSSVDLPGFPGDVSPFVLGATHHGGSVYVAGVSCTRGRITDDTGQIRCDPDDLVLARLDIEPMQWQNIAPPAEAAVVDGQGRGVTLAAFGE